MKSSVGSTTKEEVITLIYRVFKLMHKPAGPAEQEELSSEQLQSMFVMSKGGCTAGGLAKQLNVTLPTASVMADRLVSRGWVARSQDPDDRRIVRLELTPEGKTVLEKAKQARLRRWSRLLDTIPEADVETLRRVFSDLSRELEAAKPAEESV